jgi:hypothetical protein
MVGEYYPREDAIVAAVDKAAVDAIADAEIDFSDYLAGSGVVGKEDPVITIRGAMAVED